MNKNTILKSIFCCICVCAVLSAAFWGVPKRNSYTDSINESGFSDMVYVAGLSERMAVSISERMKTTLNQAPNIVKITPVSKTEHVFYCGYQKVRIIKVYKSETLKENDIILIASDSWRAETLKSLPPMSYGRGFVNFFTEGSVYLAFLSDEIDQLYSKIPVYNPFQDFDRMVVITSVFNYQNIENKIPKTIYSNSTYMLYSEVKDNEFFSTTEIGLAAMEDLKNTVISNYH